MQLSVEINNKIVDFLISIPGMADKDARRAFIARASLDAQCEALFDFNKPAAQFFQLLVPNLTKYGKLQDGRDALEAVLEAAKHYIGQNRKEYCETLIQQWREYYQKITPFIPGYKYDIFVSYDKADEEEVLTLVRLLKSRLGLRNLLGGENVFSLWKSDGKLPTAILR